MNNDEYILTQNMLINAAKLLSALDLNAFLARARTADNVGAVFHPTLYRAAAKRLDLIIELAAAAIPVQAALKKLHAEMAAELEHLVEKPAAGEPLINLIEQ
jgi:hypothetical protein